MRAIQKHEEIYSSSMFNESARTLAEFVQSGVLSEVVISTRTPEGKPYFREGVSRSYEDRKADFKCNTQLQNARRFIKFYFLNAYTYYKNGYITLPALRTIVDKTSFVMLFQCIEPMEWILSKSYDKKPFEELMCLCSDIYKKHQPIADELNLQRKRQSKTSSKKFVKGSKHIVCDAHVTVRYRNKRRHFSHQ